MKFGKWLLVCNAYAIQKYCSKSLSQDNAGNINVDCKMIVSRMFTEQQDALKFSREYPGSLIMYPPVSNQEPYINAYVACELADKHVEKISHLALDLVITSDTRSKPIMHEKAYFYLVMLSSKEEKNIRNNEEYRKELIKEKKEAVELNNSGNEYYRSGNYEEAVKFYDKALEKDPDLSLASDNRKKAWEKKEKKEAVELNNSGNEYYRSGNYEEAVKFYNKALEKDPDLSLASDNRRKAWKKIEEEKIYEI